MLVDVVAQRHPQQAAEFCSNVTSSCIKNVFAYKIRQRCEIFLKRDQLFSCRSTYIKAQKPIKKDKNHHRHSAGLILFVSTNLISSILII